MCFCSLVFLCRHQNEIKECKKQRMQFNSKEYPRQQAFTECDVKSKHVLYITKHTSLEEQKKNLKKQKWIEEAKYEKRHAYNKKKTKRQIHFDWSKMDVSCKLLQHSKMVRIMCRD